MKLYFKHNINNHLNHKNNKMKITLKNKLWQIGTGDGTRNYGNEFFNYGVAFVGPGSPGKVGSTSAKEYFEKHPEEKDWGSKLAKIKKGDWVIARSGKTRILGVGEVLEGYDHSDLFEDVEGWNLQHFIKVKWYRPNNKEKTLHLLNSTMGWSTTSACNTQEAKDLISTTDFEEVKPKCQEIWELPTELETKEITNALIDRGVRIQDAENVSSTLERIIRLTKWYEQNDYDVSEQELKALLIVPLFISLGWSEQKIKIEYMQMDMSLFDEPFTNKKENHPCLILEAKTFGNGLSFTEDQIKNYSNNHEDCKKFITTNGFRYRYLEKENGELIEKGYFNLLKLRKQYQLKQYVNGYLKTTDTLLKMSNF